MNAVIYARYSSERTNRTKHCGMRENVDLLVNKIIVYPDKIMILINVTENANTPPLDQLTEIMECSQKVLSGGGEEN